MMFAINAFNLSGNSGIIAKQSTPKTSLKGSRFLANPGSGPNRMIRIARSTSPSLERDYAVLRGGLCSSPEGTPGGRGKPQFPWQFSQPAGSGLRATKTHGDLRGNNATGPGRMFGLSQQPSDRRCYSALVVRNGCVLFSARVGRPSRKAGVFGHFL